MKIKSKITKISAITVFAFILNIPLKAENSKENIQTMVLADIVGKNKAISEDYTKELVDLSRNFQSKGDLRNTLITNKELERFIDKRIILLEDIVTIPAELVNLQKEYQARLNRSSSDVAGLWITKLEEEKKKLTIQGMLTAAIERQDVIDRISKEYSVVAVSAGAELKSTELPKVITITEATKVPITIDGEVVGEMSLSKGESYKVNSLEGRRIWIQFNSRQIAIPVGSTDLIARIEAIEKKREAIKQANGEGFEAPADSFQLKGLFIQKATYGLGKDIVDVTDRLRSLVRDNRLNESSGTHLSGRDPIFGQTKETRIIYFVDGKRFESTVREGSQIRIPE